MRYYNDSYWLRWCHRKHNNILIQWFAGSYPPCMWCNYAVCPTPWPTLGFVLATPPGSRGVRGVGMRLTAHWWLSASASCGLAGEVRLNSVIKISDIFQGLVMVRSPEFNAFIFYSDLKKYINNVLLVFDYVISESVAISLYFIDNVLQNFLNLWSSSLLLLFF